MHGPSKRRYENCAPRSLSTVEVLLRPQICLFLLPLLGLSCDSETEITCTVKSAALVQVTKPNASYILFTQAQFCKDHRSCTAGQLNLDHHVTSCTRCTHKHLPIHILAHTCHTSSGPFPKDGNITCSLCQSAVLGSCTCTCQASQ